MTNMYVAQNQEIAYRVIEDEAVILTPEDGMLHNLNPAATRIFVLANGKRKIKNIINYIINEFDVKESTATKDVINFVEDLIHKKMLILSNKPFKRPKK